MGECNGHTGVVGLLLHTVFQNECLMDNTSVLMVLFLITSIEQSIFFNHNVLVKLDRGAM